jgi:hypothetical protein
VTLPPEMLTATRDDQLSGRRHDTVYIVSYLASQQFAVCWIPSPWGVLDVEGVLESSCVVVARLEHLGFGLFHQGDATPTA